MNDNANSLQNLLSYKEIDRSQRRIGPMLRLRFDRVHNKSVRKCCNFEVEEEMNQSNKLHLLIFDL